MGIVDLIFSKTCLGCKKTGSYFCRDCAESTQKATQICPMCTRPSIDGVTHIKCKRPQGLDGFYSVWEYNGAVRKSILGLKYKFATEVARDIAKNLILDIRNRDLPFTDPTLIPIPLHQSRKNWRGFNQAGEIGKLVAKNLGWEFNGTLLTKAEKTQTQKGLDKEARRRNILGVFKIDKAMADLLDRDKTILVFDDVWTTGSTLKEATKALKRNRFKKVWSLTIAH